MPRRRPHLPQGLLHSSPSGGLYDQPCCHDRARDGQCCENPLLPCKTRIVPSRTRVYRTPLTQKEPVVPSYHERRETHDYVRGSEHGSRDCGKGGTPHWDNHTSGNESNDCK